MRITFKDDRYLSRWDIILPGLGPTLNDLSFLILFKAKYLNHIIKIIYRYLKPPLSGLLETRSRNYFCFCLFLSY